MRYEGAACLTVDEADRDALAPGDELGHKLVTFIEQLPADRRKLIYIADSFQKKNLVQHAAHPEVQRPHA